VAAAAGPRVFVRRRPSCRSACVPSNRGACAGDRTRRRACDCERICPRARDREPPCRCACGRAPLCPSGSAVFPCRPTCTCARGSRAAAFPWAPR